MPKYIDREKLPQFLYYHFCCDKYDWWNLNDGYHAAYKGESDTAYPFSMTIDYNEDDIDINLFGDMLIRMIDAKENKADRTQKDPILNEFYETVIQKLSAKDDKSEAHKLVILINVLLKAMFKDQDLAQKWQDRLYEEMRKYQHPDMSQAMLILAMLDEYLSFAMLLQTAQGFPLQYRDGSCAYPKMLLVEKELYEKYKGSQDVRLDFSFIKKTLGEEVYVVTVNGDCAEKKMIFLLIPAGDMITVSMLDPRNGISEFHVSTDSDASTEMAVNEYNRQHTQKMSGTCIVGHAWHCHPRGDYWCNGHYDYCIYNDGKHNCIHRSMDIVSSILYCFQEYQRKRLYARETAKAKKGSTGKPEKPTEPFIPSGMMRLYDIKLSGGELERFNKFGLYGKGGSTYASTEKSPHVRRGTMRYNPKTGQRDIPVRGSVIHKEKYQGFASAERVKT